MKTPVLLILGLAVLISCGQDQSQQAGKKPSRVISSKKNPRKANVKPIKVSNLTIEDLKNDTSNRKKPYFDGTLIVGKRYPIQVKAYQKNRSVKWLGFEEVRYIPTTDEKTGLVYYATEAPDYGRFILNPTSGRLFHECIAAIGQQNDTLYFDVLAPEKEEAHTEDFAGMYSIISPNRDSAYFEVRSIAPFKYEYATKPGNTPSLIYFHGRDRFGLLHYGNHLTMNSDHQSGLYSMDDDSNSTVIKLEKIREF